MRKPKVRLDRSQIASLVAFYQSGYSQLQCAKMFDCSQSYVQVLLAREEIEIRFCPWKQERIDRCVALYQVGDSVSQVARLMKTNKRIVRKYLRRSKVRIRPHAEATGRMEKNGNWRGGRSVGEYIYLCKKEHPSANYAGYVLEHRLVMEQHLGRFLDSEEVVHHKNGNKHDNRIENLELFSTNGDHLAAELKGRCPKWTAEGKKRILAAHRQWCQQQRILLHSKADARASRAKCDRKKT